jgi:phosphoheptose isomerase
MNKNPFLSELCRRYPVLNSNKDRINEAVMAIISCYQQGGKLLICGNGGSSADADHMAGELMKSFESVRPLNDNIKKRLSELAGRGEYLALKLESGLPAISLSVHTALATAISNDIDPNLVFAQQVIVFGKEKDVLIAMSTSGNSQNVLDACIAARALNMKIVGLTGETGGKMRELCDILINVPESRTAFIQELHLPVIHTLCLIAEKHFYPKPKS